jgi:hypothetical protein
MTTPKSFKPYQLYAPPTVHHAFHPSIIASSDLHHDPDFDFHGSNNSCEGVGVIEVEEVENQILVISIAPLNLMLSLTLIVMQL